MNKKIAFITCVNNEEEYAESLYYIPRLLVPEGYELDIIAVREATSMASGYQAAMESTDAKYKVYLHQDTFIIHRDFILNMLKVFQGNAQIGMIGCIGCDELPLSAQAVSAWNVGLVYHNCVPSRMERRQSGDESPVRVEAVDGLLMATQYDVRWREDLFDGWDFYDVSQCLEMQRAGYEIVVPYQKKPWCYHDNTYSKMTEYYNYCEKAVREYQDIKSFVASEHNERRSEYDLLREASRRELKDLVERGEKEELIKLFADENNRGYLHLREFEVLANIAFMEEKAGENRFWNKEDSYESLIKKIARLKYALKRMEYHADETGNACAYIGTNYSKYAALIVGRSYSVVDMGVWEKLKITN